jgi:hypothetical protein
MACLTLETHGQKRQMRSASWLVYSTIKAQGCTSISVETASAPDDGTIFKIRGQMADLEKLKTAFEEKGETVTLSD